MSAVLRERRAAAGLTQAELAREAGVSRPRVSAIEAGRHTPSVTAALALARALGASVEELFPSEEAAAVAVVEPAGEGAPLRLGRVGDRLVYAALPDRGAGATLFGAPDGVMRGGRVEILPAAETRGLVIAGCDPALGLIADLLPARGHRALPVHATTAAAQAALAAGRCHVALVHGRPSDLGAPPDGVRRFSLARWRVGIAHTPASSLSLEQLASGSVRLARRAPGAAAQTALMRALEKEAPSVRLRGPVAMSHLDAARRVALGAVDGGITIEPCARAYDLAFDPLEEHRVELWIAAPFAAHPAIQALADLLGSPAFRTRTQNLQGYELAPQLAG
ncbi:MAG: substrate-binding domain-containing protein [Myxococcota bacterium]